MSDYFDSYRSYYSEPQERRDIDYEAQDRREYHEEEKQDAYRVISVAEAYNAIKLRKDELRDAFTAYSNRNKKR